MLKLRTDWLACLPASLLLGAALMLDGCATSRQPGGDGATLMPGIERLRIAARDAAVSPRVWVPLAGAALFQVDDWDRKVSDWARRETPVFGSQRSAADWSNRLRTASFMPYVVTVVLAPGTGERGEWARDETQGLLVGLGAIGATSLATSALKNQISRTRPDGEDDQSFPSGHTSLSAVATGLARDNLRAFDLSGRSRRTLDLGLDALTVGTAWARVEAGAHFPADTLAAMALGSFVSRFADEAFLGIGPARHVAWMLAPLRGGVELQWALNLDPDPSP